MKEIHGKLGDLSALLSGKKVLITGGAGMLASCCAHYLMYLNGIFRDDPVTVILMVRNVAKARLKFAEYLNRSCFKIVEQDVTVPLDEDFEDVDFIMHAASKASPKFYALDPVDVIRTNAIGTYNLLEFARRQKKAVPFLYFSSGAVYGDTTSAASPVKETDICAQNNLTLRACYSESKKLGETLCYAYHYQFGTPARIIRFAHTFGPSLSLDDDRVFSEFAADIVNNRNICMLSSGNATRSFCYITDAADGIFRVLLKGEDGTAYNLVNNDNYISIRELAQRLAALYPEKGLRVVRKDRAADEPLLYTEGVVENKPLFDVSRLRGLGWEPTVSLEEGFKRTVDYLIDTNKAD